MPCLAGMCGGPVVGIIVGIARGIPSGTPAVDLLVQIKGIYWYFVWKQIIKIDNEKKRWVVFGVLTFLLGFFVEQPLCVAGNAFILICMTSTPLGLSHWVGIRWSTRFSNS